MCLLTAGHAGHPRGAERVAMRYFRVSPHVGTLIITDEAITVSGEGGRREEERRKGGTGGLGRRGGLGREGGRYSL